MTPSYPITIWRVCCRQCSLQLTPWTGDPSWLLTTKEASLQIQGQMEEFVTGMVGYRIDFANPHWLQTFLRLAEACRDRERAFNMAGGPTPTTWCPKATNGMYYRTRPVAREMDTLVVRTDVHCKPACIHFEGFETWPKKRRQVPRWICSYPRGSRVAFRRWMSA